MVLASHCLMPRGKISHDMECITSSCLGFLFLKSFSSSLQDWCPFVIFLIQLVFRWWMFASTKFIKCLPQMMRRLKARGDFHLDVTGLLEPDISCNLQFYLDYIQVSAFCGTWSALANPGICKERLKPIQQCFSCCDLTLCELAKLSYSKPDRNRNSNRELRTWN